jgi:hypothetical protein
MKNLEDLPLSEETPAFSKVIAVGKGQQQARAFQLQHRPHSVDCKLGAAGAGIVVIIAGGSFIRTAAIGNSRGDSIFYFNHRFVRRTAAAIIT